MSWKASFSLQETRAPNDWPVAIDGRLMGSGTRLYDTPTTSNGVMNIAAIVPIANLRADLRFTTPIMPGGEKDETGQSRGNSL